MDPSSPTTAGSEMPASVPSADMIPLMPGHEAAAEPETYRMPPAPVAGVQQTQPSPPPSMPPAYQAQPLPQPAPASAHPSAPAIAEDVDLIEKEWVEKAKSIVTKTRNDPHTQNAEMNRFKADYMQKRYGKDIKIEP